MSSSRPVKLTGWNDTTVTLSALSMAKRDDRAHLVVVHAVDDGDHQHDVDAGAVQVLDRAQLDVEEVADLAMAVGLVADAVELQVAEPQAGLPWRPGRTPAPGRSECRSTRTARRSSRSRARSASASRKCGLSVGSPPENCTLSWRRGLTVKLSSRIFWMSSHSSSCT